MTEIQASICCTHLALNSFNIYYSAGLFAAHSHNSLLPPKFSSLIFWGFLLLYIYIFRLTFFFFSWSSTLNIAFPDHNSFRLDISIKFYLGSSGYDMSYFFDYFKLFSPLLSLVSSNLTMMSLGVVLCLLFLGLLNFWICEFIVFMTFKVFFFPFFQIFFSFSLHLPFSSAPTLLWKSIYISLL